LVIAGNPLFDLEQADFCAQEVLTSIFGQIEIYHHKTKPYFFVKASGHISFSLIQKNLKAAQCFSENQDGEWSYMVDLQNVRFFNPLNMIELIKLSRWPKLDSYIVINPPLFLAPILILFSPIFKAKMVLIRE